MASSSGEQQAAATLAALPWLLERYCNTLAAHKRLAAADQAVAAQLMSRAKQQHHEQQAGSDKDQAASGGGSVHPCADFHFFALLLHPLLQQLAPQQERGSGGGADGDGAEARRLKKRRRREAALERDPFRSRTWSRAAEAAAALVRTCKGALLVYRPTDDADGSQLALLSRLAAAATAHASDAPADAPTADTAAAVRLLAALLDLEHRAIVAGPHLLWPLIWRAAARHGDAAAAMAGRSRQHGGPGSGVGEGWERGNGVVGEAGMLLVGAYSELRQLDVLLTAWVHALRGVGSGGDTASVVASAATCDARLLAAVAEAVAHAPSGQAAALVTLVGEQAAGLASQPPTAAGGATASAAGELLATVLAAVHVDLTTSSAVAVAVQGLLRAIASCTLRQLHAARGRQKDASDGTAALLLRIYLEAVRLHAACTALQPQIAPLPDQSPSPSLRDSGTPLGSSSGHFAALAAAAGGDGGSSINLAPGLLDVLTSVVGSEPRARAAAASPPQYELQYVLLASGTYRLAVLHERWLRCRGSCAVVTEEEMQAAPGGGVDALALSERVAQWNEDMRVAAAAAEEELRALAATLSRLLPGAADVAALARGPEWSGVVGGMGANLYRAAAWALALDALPLLADWAPREAVVRLLEAAFECAVHRPLECAPDDAPAPRATSVQPRPCHPVAASQELLSRSDLLDFATRTHRQPQLHEAWAEAAAAVLQRLLRAVWAQAPGGAGTPPKRKKSKKAVKAGGGEGKQLVPQALQLLCGCAADAPRWAVPAAALVEQLAAWQAPELVVTAGSTGPVSCESAQEGGAGATSQRAGIVAVEQPHDSGKRRQAEQQAGRTGDGTWGEEAAAHLSHACRVLQLLAYAPLQALLRGAAATLVCALLGSASLAAAAVPIACGDAAGLRMVEPLCDTVAGAVTALATASQGAAVVQVVCAALQLQLLPWLKAVGCTAAVAALSRRDGSVAPQHAAQQALDASAAVVFNVVSLHCSGHDALPGRSCGAGGAPLLLDELLAPLGAAFEDAEQNPAHAAAAAHAAALSHRGASSAPGLDSAVQQWWVAAASASALGAARQALARAEEEGGALGPKAAAIIAIPAGGAPLLHRSAVEACLNALGPHVAFALDQVSSPAGDDPGRSLLSTCTTASSGAMWAQLQCLASLHHAGGMAAELEFGGSSSGGSAQAMANVTLNAAALASLLRLLCAPWLLEDGQHTVRAASGKVSAGSPSTHPLSVSPLPPSIADSLATKPSGALVAGMGGGPSSSGNGCRPMQLPVSAALRLVRALRSRCATLSVAGKQQAVTVLAAVHVQLMSVLARLEQAVPATWARDAAFLGMPTTAPPPGRLPPPQLCLRVALLRSLRVLLVDAPLPSQQCVLAAALSTLSMHFDSTVPPRPDGDDNLAPMAAGAALDDDAARSDGGGADSRADVAWLASLRDLVGGEHSLLVGGDRGTPLQHGRATASVGAVLRPPTLLPYMEMLLCCMEGLTQNSALRQLARHTPKLLDTCQGVLLLLVHDGVGASTSPSAVAMGVTALRCLESALGRSSLFAMSSRQMAACITAVSLPFEAAVSPAMCAGSTRVAGASGCDLPLGGCLIGGALFVGAARVAAVVLRHRCDAAERCLHLLLGCCRALLLVLVRWQAWGDCSDLPGNGKQAVERCAAELAHVYQELAACKAAGGRFCVLALADYCVYAATPAAASTYRTDGGKRPSGLVSALGASTLREGAYALYDTCGPREVQWLYSSLGRESGLAGGAAASALRREALTQLRQDYEKQFKFSGKV